MNDQGRDTVAGDRNRDEAWFDHTLRSGNEVAPPALRHVVADIANGSIDPSARPMVHAEPYDDAYNDPYHDNYEDSPRRWPWFAAAAAVVVLMGGGIWLATGGDDDQLQSADGPSATPLAPVATVDGATGDTTASTLATVGASTVPIQTAPSTVAPTIVPVTTVPATTAPVATVPTTTFPSTTAPAFVDPIVASCFDGMNGDVALRTFVVARADDSQLADLEPCVSSLDPFQLSSFAPACWEPCTAPRTFRTDALAVAEYLTLSPQWGVSIPVTYFVDGAQVDSAERWEAVADPSGGYRFTLVSIDAPLTTREEAVAVIEAYFAAIADEDWEAVAAFLNDGAIESEERQDLQRLGITDYSKAGIAAGLAEWCSAGCVSNLPLSAALLPNGYTYEIVNGNEVIKVVWYEGYLSIMGLPFQR